MIGSLGVRRDAASVPALAALLGDADKAVACAAACALGDIGTPEAAKALGESAKNAPEGREAGRRRRLAGLRRAAAGRRQEGRSDGRLQVAQRRRPAQARSPGGHPRLVVCRRQKD